MAPKQIFREGPQGLFAGIFAFLLGASLAVEPADHLIVGTAMVLSNGRTISSGTHMSNPRELLFLLGFWVLWSSLGIYLIADWLNRYVEANPQELVGHNLFRRATFRRPWSEINRVDRKTSLFRKDEYIVYAGSEKLRIRCTADYAEDLIHLIQKRCPGLDFSPWR